MIVCSNCQHENMEGAMFCAECGAQLLGKDGVITQTIGTDQIRKAIGQDSPGQAYHVPGVSEAWGNLHLLETGHILPLTTRTEFTLGRVSEGQPIIPDIDLSPYQAHASGVSRMHAIVRHDGEHIMIMDLGSANGTFLNGRRLAANVEQPLAHGDMLALGKLKIQLLVRTA